MLHQEKFHYIYITPNRNNAKPPPLSPPAAPSPANVPLAYGNPANIDPEEAFVAAIASCHTLTFLFLAYRAGFRVDAYEDAAVGQMQKNERGIAWISRVTLHPMTVYGAGHSPNPHEEAQLHHRAHDQCIIANSVKTEVLVDANGPKSK